MNESIFRQKNIERISSPEKLNDYVRVTNPSIWIVLIGTVLLLAGAIVWAIAGRLDTYVTCVAVSENDGLICLIGENDISGINIGDSVEVGGQIYKISSIADRPVNASQLDEYALHRGSLDQEKWVFKAELEGSLPDGIYDASILTEQISPISFIFN